MHAHVRIHTDTNAEGNTGIKAGNKFSLVDLIQICICIHTVKCTQNIYWYTRIRTHLRAQRQSPEAYQQGWNW